MKVVLFCGGLGMRMRDGVTNAPKADGHDRRPPADVARDALLRALRPHRDFVLCLGYGASAVKDFFLNYDETAVQRLRARRHRAGGAVQDRHLRLADHVRRHRAALEIGERLRRVRRFVEGEEMFLANYADVFTNAPLPDMISRFTASDAVASLLAVPPQSSHHVVDVDDSGLITQVMPVRELRQWENGGYFVLRPEIFDYLHEGEDLLGDAIPRLVQQRKVLAYPYKGYWTPADTVKERAHLEEMYHRGNCPWMVWDPERSGVAGAPETGVAAAVRPAGLGVAAP
jgi:glucose-1-phosphate cytidylyltransferase